MINMGNHSAMQSIIDFFAAGFYSNILKKRGWSDPRAILRPRIVNDQGQQGRPVNQAVTHNKLVG